jgi:hypothetical protein
VIGVTAAESAVKGCIALLQPQTKWLIENTPSPSLQKLLTEYLPNLPVKCQVSGKPRVPDNSVLKLLKKGASIRNIIVHGGSCSLKMESLKEILVAVKDLLWLMDYYCGQSWALDHVSDDAKKELGVEDVAS